MLVCRKCKDHACVAQMLRAHTRSEVELVRCQKICHGPVVGTKVDGRFEWFERVDDLRSIAALLRLAQKGANKVPKPLRKHRVKSHRGRPPRR